MVKEPLLNLSTKMLAPLLTWLLTALHLNFLQGSTRTFEITVGPGSINPDCNMTRPVLLVNGQFPAPPIRVNKNDNVHIIVRNSFESQQSVTVHFHGILQIGTPEADGVPEITQDPIPPGGEYHHRFSVINQIGTYFYHAHVDFLDETIVGPFIVYENDAAWPENNQFTITEGPYTYDDERTVLLTEFWHQTERDRYAYTMGPNYTQMEAANSYLINGRTIYQPGNPASDCQGYTMIDVEPQKVYRLRIIGGLTMAVLGFAVEDHMLTVIEVDGTFVKPYQTPFVEVAPGQRLSVLLTTDKEPRTYYIDTNPYYILPQENNGAAVLRYTSSSSEIDRWPGRSSASLDLDFSKKPLGRYKFPAQPQPEWIFPSLSPASPEANSVLSFEDPPTRTIIIIPEEYKTPDNRTRWTLNGHPPPSWDMPILEQLQHRTRRKVNQTIVKLNIDQLGDGYDPALQTFPLNFGEVVDFVIHATTLPNGVCIAHPWHTHGMVHYTLASGAGEYNHAQDEALRTFKTPFARDTSLVYSIQPGPPPKTPGGLPCGWTKIRVHAVNPGPWAFHCHITSHMLQGMMAVLEVAPDKMLGVHK